MLDVLSLGYAVSQRPAHLWVRLACAPAVQCPLAAHCCCRTSIRVARFLACEPNRLHADRALPSLSAVADCLLSQNFQVKPRPRPQAPQAAPQAAQQPPRQHFAVRQQPGKVGLSLPQQGWQPPADAAGAAAEPFAPPAHGQQQAAGQQQQQQQEQQQQQPVAAGGPAAMDVEFEDI